MPFSPELLPQYMAQHMARYGYVLVETPMIEPADLFLTKAGDQIIDRLFTFDFLGKQYALRPEFTASAASRYVHTTHDKVVRWQFQGAIFENNPENPSQRYQHHSIGAELIGSGGSTADAEIISMAALGLIALGIPEYQLVIGHVGLTRRALERFALDARAMRFLLNHRVMLKEQGKSAVLTALDRYLSVEAVQNLPMAATTVSAESLSAMLPNRSIAMGGRSREDIARRLIEKQQRHANRSQIIAALDFLVRWDELQGTVDVTFDQISEILGGDQPALKILAEWRATLDLLNAYAIPLERITVQPDLVRNWDYYTGVVFELRVPSAFASPSAALIVGGGGRYDELTHLIGGADHTPAVGFTYYADVLTRLLYQETSSHHQPITLADYGVVSIRWAQRLRAQGVNIVLVSPESTQDITLWATDDDSILLNNDTYTRDDLSRLLTDLEALRQ